MLRILFHVFVPRRNYLDAVVEDEVCDVYREKHLRPIHLGHSYQHLRLKLGHMKFGVGLHFIFDEGAVAREDAAVVHQIVTLIVVESILTKYHFFYCHYRVYNIRVVHSHQ